MGCVQRAQGESRLCVESDMSAEVSLSEIPSLREMGQTLSRSKVSQWEEVASGGFQAFWRVCGWQCQQEDLGGI